MSYIVTYYTKAVTPSCSYHKTKLSAIKEASEEIKQAKKDYYKGSGYKQTGSLESGIIMFKHPIFGADFMVKIEKNNKRGSNK